MLITLNLESIKPRIFFNLPDSVVTILLCSKTFNFIYLLYHINLSTFHPFSRYIDHWGEIFLLFQFYFMTKFTLLMQFCFKENTDLDNFTFPILKQVKE